MSDTVTQNPSALADVLSELDSSTDFDTLPRGGRRWTRWLVRAFILLVIVGGIGFALWIVLGSLESKAGPALQTHTVGQGDLLITVTEDGNLESAINLDIKCEVAGGSTILWIIDDGKEVEEGQELVKLESSQLEDQINAQKIVYEKARATYIQADKTFEVSKIAVREYLEGTYRQQMQDLEAKVTIAMENLRSAENTLQHTQRMFNKGYVTPLQLETQQFAVERSKLDLGTAQTTKDVLERFTKIKMVTDLESQRDTAEAKKASEKASLDLEEARLKRLENMLTKCAIRAPKAGMVVYANEQSRGRMGSSSGPDIKEGAMVRDQQTLLRLPDLTKMQVKVTVHESKVDRLRRGMRARIRIQDREFQGYVHSVANQPEPTSFFSAQVKEYATIVKVEGESKDLRPGMTAEAEILVAHLKNVVSVPVATVFEQRGNTYCYVKTPGKPELRPVKLGMSNDKFVEVTSGLKAGEEVVLNPRSIQGELQQDAPKQEGVDVQKKFGSGGAPPAEANDSKGPGGGQGGPSGKRSMDMMQFDKNGDKKLSKDEVPEQMAGMWERVGTSFEKLDRNSDGFLDASELAELRKLFQSRRGSGQGGPGGPSGGPGGQGGFGGPPGMGPPQGGGGPPGGRP